MPDIISGLSSRLAPLILQVTSHPLYREINTISRLRLFMQQHVFAVWDFMCLLKALHSRIVVTSAPWFPPKDALGAHLIGSILAEEEGDLIEDGSGYLSHYEIYIRAMEAICADTQPISKLLSLLSDGKTIAEALSSLPVLDTTRTFVLTTFGFFEQGVHELMASFVYGREGLTGPMFEPLLKQIESQDMDLYEHNDRLRTFAFYLRRHIQLDSHHFTKALQMLSRFVGADEQRIQEAEAAAVQSLMARINFLTGIQNAFFAHSGVI